jgi:purine-binding chemotaxis protein CheW
MPAQRPERDGPKLHAWPSAATPNPPSPDDPSPQAEQPVTEAEPAVTEAEPAATEAGSPAKRPPAARRKPAARKRPAAAKTPAARTPAATPEPAAATPPQLESLQAVVFSLADDEYALPIDQVHEVIAFREPRGVASGTSWVRGVINLRGLIVPVCDLAARLGRDGGQAPSAKIVIVEAPTGAAGLIVDSVREVLTIAAEQLDRVTFTNDAAVTSIAKLGERLVVMLDAPAVLAEANLQDVGRPSG